MNSSEFTIISEKINKVEKRLKEMFLEAEKEIEFKVDQKLKKVDERALEIDKRMAILVDRELKNKRVTDFMEKQDERNAKNKITFSNIEASLENAVAKYDTIIKDNLTLPGLLGDYGQFKTLSQLLSFVLEELGKLAKNIRRNEIEIKLAKKDIEKTTVTSKNIVTTAEANLKAHTKNIIEMFKQDTENKLKVHQEKFSKALEITANHSIEIEEKVKHLKNESVNFANIKKVLEMQILEEKSKVDEFIKNFETSQLKRNTKSELADKKLKKDKSVAI